MALALTGFAPSTPARAATGPKVAVIVGPAGSATAGYKVLANAAASRARAHGASVVKVYSPNATWSRVRSALTGASIVIYYGRGRGYPSPYSSKLIPSFENGLGLNPKAGHGNTRIRFYGEKFIRGVRLAPNSLVLLCRATFASGMGDGRAQPSLRVAKRRVDNYGAGFRTAGAAAVIAERSCPTAYYLDGVFSHDQTIDTMWRHAPTRNGHVKSFKSTRRPGSIGRLDPDRASSGYVRSVIGRLGVTTAAIRGSSPVVTTPPPAPTQPTPAGSGATYGPAINADSLNNSVVGGSGNRRVSYRFRAGISSPLNWVRIYLQSGSGYSGGNGGSLEISVHADDGTSNHAPAAASLASVVIRPGNPISMGNLPKVSFGSPAGLTAGRLYHIVFRNVDSSPTSNYVSVNGLYTFGSLSTWQPKYTNTDWANLIYVNGSWSSNRGSGAGVITPILALGYASGRVDGVGYMEVWPSSAQTISGSSAVRETFRVSGSSRHVAAVSIRLRRTSGSGGLGVRLETSAGSVIDQGSIPASAITTGSNPAWATFKLAATRTLASGQGYNLVLTSPSGTSYSVFPIRKGSTYGFPSSTWFADGSGQITTGSGWRSFSQPGGGSNGSEADLQLLFR
jgi:hypothetical protein